MSVSNEPEPVNIENEIEDLRLRISTMNRVIENLKRKGHPTYTEELLKEKLSHVTKMWDDMFGRYTTLRKPIHHMTRNKYDFFKQEEMNEGIDAFLEFQNFVGTELAQLAAAKKVEAPGTSYQAPIEFPRQRLPKYGGDPQQWQHFEDLFTSGVINNVGLTDLQKLHQLNACLEGRAMAAIASVRVEEGNFQEAWDTLKQKFGLPRIMTAKLLDQLTKLKPIKSGDLASMEQITVEFKQALAALKKLGTPEQRESWLLSHLVKTKFDMALELEWERSLKLSTEYPMLEKVMDFLETETRAMLVISEQHRKPTSNTHPKPHTQTHNAVVEKSTVATTACLFCGQPHTALHCNNFMRMAPSVRYEAVRTSQGCILCLAPSHTAKHCSNPEKCSKCGRGHNTLLHFEQPQREAEFRRPVAPVANGKKGGKRYNGPPPRPVNKNRAPNKQTSPASTSHASA